MKESSEDIIIKNIKEALEQYEPDYSPQFWERIRKQRPVPELSLKTLLLKNKFWLSVFIITGVLFIVYKVTIVLPPETISVTEPVSSESSIYFVSEKPTEITPSGKTSFSGYNSISNVKTSQEEKSLSSDFIPALITDPLSAYSPGNIQPENIIADRPEGFKNIPVPASLAEIYSGNHYNLNGLIPIEYQVGDSMSLKTQESKKTRKLIFHWPDFNSPVKKGGYDRFAGPNKLAFFYSPEIHYNGSFGAVGVSQGIGISLEGPIRSLISFSAGLSIQAINFQNKTIFSGKVPPYGLVLQPSDTNTIFYYNDSTVFCSGSYKFLELPVSVSYKFIESARSQVWLGAGISAIAFLRQNYTYDIVVEEISESSSISVKAWENIHPLASLNFSLLYRYNLSYRSLLHGTIQYKQHLVPLGYNSMKLNRLDMQVGIIYRFGRMD